MSRINDIQTLASFLIFLTIITVLSLLGLYFFKNVVGSQYYCTDANNIVSIFVAIVSVFLGVLISFLIVTVWGEYSAAGLSDEREAQDLYLLYSTVFTLPNSENILDLIIEYTEYLINVEFPAGNVGNAILDEGGEVLQNLQQALYNYVPRGTHQFVIYNKGLDILDRVIESRVNRLYDASGSISWIMWGVTIIDSILIIVMTWFLNCEGFFHYLLVLIIAIYVASGIFLIYVFSYPYTGYLALTPEPFQKALNNMLKL